MNKKKEINKKRIKAFTLVELLAVIIILSVIATIVIPTITGIVEETKSAADLRSAEGYISAAENFYTSSLLDPNKANMLDNETNVINQLELSDNTATGKITIDSTGKVTMAIIINNKCYTKNGNQNIDEINVSENLAACSTLYTESILNGADPVVSSGMIPVTIDNDGTVKKANINSPWYKYEDHKWANIVIVNETSRGGYQTATSDTIINPSDILGYFVWIPRYSYQLFNADGLEGTSAQEIQIRFENKDTKSNGKANGEWLTSPGFTFGSEELNGIWVAKFETTGSSYLPTVLPNQESLRTQRIAYQFATAQRLDNEKYYGINNESHMVKNSEWGATAYLSQSKYGRCVAGICTEISINNSPKYITGSSAGRPGDDTTKTDPTYAYNTEQGFLASTTGNITGIYDMSGGSSEVTFGVLIDENGNKYVGNKSYGGGFNGILGDGTAYTNGANFPNDKYYETYRENQNVLGEGLLETRGWNGTTFMYPTATDPCSPYFRRGGWNTYGSKAGIWQYIYGNGFDGGGISFRIALSPKNS